MKPCVALVCVAGVLVACGCKKKAPNEPPTPIKAGFRPFTSAQGRFTVEVPTAATEKFEAALDGATTTFLTTDREDVYMVSYTDVPIPSGESAAQIQARLNSARDGIARNVGGRVTSSDTLTLGGEYPGRDVRTELPDGTVLHARVYLVDRRLYQVIVVGPRSLVDSPEATRFLDSLTVTP